MDAYLNYMLVDALLALVFSLYICKISGGISVYLLIHLGLFSVMGIKLVLVFFLCYLIMCAFSDRMDDFGYELHLGKKHIIFKDKPIMQTRLMLRLVGHVTSEEYKTKVMDNIIEKMPGEWE